MTPQFLSEKMSRHLSSLVPGFEGHWTYRDSKTKTFVACGENYVCPCEGGIVCSDHQTICPAWQAEDVLRNLANILLARKNKRMGISSILKVIVTEFAIAPDTAYQKIEEYLWGILK